MSKILVAYATMAGATAEVAKVVGEEISKCGLEIDVLPIGEVEKLDGYDAVVLGGPMIMGWHRGALGFLNKHRKDFERIPLAVFVLAMSLTRTGDMRVEGVPLCLDENLPKPPANSGQLNFRERYATLSNYLRPILKSSGSAKPASIGVFGGRMEYGRLKWWAEMFAMLIIRAPAGEKRNWPLIRSWAASLPDAFNTQRT